MTSSVPLISATGSVRMGREVAAARRRSGSASTILELGGNNALIVMDDADLEMAARTILFGAVGTAGPALHQHAPRLRPREHHRALQERLLAAYKTIAIGAPLDAGTLMAADRPGLHRHHDAGHRDCQEPGR